MFAKVFYQIFESSIAEDYIVRHVFTDLLVLADEEGLVDKTPESISRITNVPLELVNRAISKLCDPDPKSRTPDDDGRRLVLLNGHRDWGWKIVNYLRYRGIRDQEARRIANCSYKREQRAKKKILDCPPMSTPVLDSQHRSASVSESQHIAEEEADADAEVIKLTPQMVSRGVLETCCLSGKELIRVLDDVCASQMKSGRDPIELRDALVASWNSYVAAMPELKFVRGAEKFFGQGFWSNEALWRENGTHNGNTETKQERVFREAIADNDQTASDYGRATRGGRNLT